MLKIFTNKNRKGQNKQKNEWTPREKNQQGNHKIKR